MKTEKLKAQLRIWLLGFGVITLIAAIAMFQWGQIGLGFLALAFCALEFFAFWSISR